MRIAVTGGSGALGRTLIRRLIADGMDRIVTSSRDEQKRDALAQEFGCYPGFRVYAADVRQDSRRLADMFYGCEVVVHAAARKVVTGQPDEADEMLRTNILGTQNVIEAAREASVQRLLFISSDKAVHAEAQAYGLSKAYAERLVITMNARTFSRGLRLSALRYGNCLASTGSVVLCWRKQLAAGEPIRISDLRMTRFWLSLDQAADHVITALRIMRGGEILVPHIPAAPLTLLAQALTEDGLMPRFMVSGIRHGGEKLHEQLLSADEARRALKWQNMYVVPPDVPTDLRWDTTRWSGEPVDEEILYRSDVWPNQASLEDLRRLIG